MAEPPAAERTLTGLAVQLMRVRVGSLTDGRANELRAWHLLLGRTGHVGHTAATVFYTSLFGWEAEELPAGAAGAFTPLRRGGRDVAVLYEQMPEARAVGAPPHWTSFVSVEDADSTAARASELGGAAIFGEPFDVLDAGRVAAIRDPMGAIVSLWQPRAQVGAGLVNDVGALCWNELATSDVERSKAFFGELFGWRFESDEAGYTTIRNGGSLNGGIRAQSEQERGSPPSWLPYFTVPAAEAAAHEGIRLGGRVLVPAVELAVGRFAVIADPQGAVLAVFEGETDP